MVNRPSPTVFELKDLKLQRRRRPSQGSLPPIFCVVNAEYEFANLAAALGPEQPVYAFRSLYFVPDCDEDLIQALALRYVKDLEQVYPDGPLFLLPIAMAAKSPCRWRSISCGATVKCLCSSCSNG